MSTTNIINAICEARGEMDSYKVCYEVNRALYDHDEYDYYDDEDEED